MNGDRRPEPSSPQHDYGSVPLSSRNNLDFFRTLLALGVVAFPAFDAVGIKYPQFPWVPAFIAISGFLITESMRLSRGYGHFTCNRLLRVGPAFALSLVLVAVLDGSITDVLFDWAAMGLATRGANPPLWSLSVEEVPFFCLAVWFALGVYATRRKAVSTLLALYVLGVIRPIMCRTMRFPSIGLHCVS